MGEGKSCVSSQLSKAVAKYTNTPFTYHDNLTFLRKELKVWVDGEGESKKGQKPEKSSLLADELISMFYKRNWYDTSQIEGVELLNKCRDRHLCVMGNIPNFWDLDKGLYAMISYRVHVKERGLAWIFEKDTSPFVRDKWNELYNQKVFAKKKNPYDCRGFVGMLRWDDWPPEEKAEYYEVRNTKRVNTEGQRNDKQTYSKIKGIRDDLIRFVLNKNPNIKQSDVAAVAGMSTEHVSRIFNNKR